MKTPTSPPSGSAPPRSGTRAKKSAGKPSAPALGPVGMARWAWRQLTSMRTALFLLLLVAVAAVPGSIFPQRSLDAGRVDTYLADHPGVGPWLDRLGLFDVFASPWFSAIYLLLMVSLVGCIVPRTKMHWHALRTRPPRAPRNLRRLPSHGSVQVDGTVAEVTARVRAGLGRHYRVADDSDSDEGVLAAESGYLRETGNLLFHVALLVLIVALAWGHLVGWRADRIVPAGQSFANSVSSYDTFSAGPWVNPEALQPFTVRIDRMDVRFETDLSAGTQIGAPRDFRAQVTVTPRPGAPGERRELAVNQPLDFGGAQVYLLGNGYAPLITVRDAAGQVVFRQEVPFLAQDDNYTSTGAVKVAGAKPDQLGLAAIFLPTATADDRGVRSTFPDQVNPVLVFTAFTGDLFPGGRPQSVYTLDTSRMTPVQDASGNTAQFELRPGQSVDLPAGRGTVTFEGVERWAGISTRYDPVRPLALGAALVAALGIVASLLIRRRRVYVRVVTVPSSGGAPSCRVDVGALAKGEDPMLDGAVDAVLARAAGRAAGDKLRRDPLDVHHRSFDDG
ncbi:MAG: cytochrome c biogenesis protein ResB [Dermatophilaceae bacterium]